MIAQESHRNCSSKNFKSLMLTQFLGAFNDNVYKLVVSLLALKLLVTESGGTFYISLGGALFVLPYILFSPYAGYLADHFSKTKIMKILKFTEIVVMSLALLGLVFGSMPALFVVLFLMGTQSALFSPSKYGVLPEFLNNENLSRGNGYIQFWTFIAIITGTVAGGQLMVLWGERLFFIGLSVVGIAALGFFASLLMGKGEVHGEKRIFEPNGFKEIFHSLKDLSKNKHLFLALLAVSYFWFAGAFFQMNTLLYSKQILGLGDQGTSLLLFALALGIGMGSIAAGVVSEGKVELGLVPIGAIGMTVFSLILGGLVKTFIPACVLLFLLGICGGFFIVPLNAFIQKESPQDSRGRFLAATNFVSNCTMLFASFMLWILKDYLHVNSAWLFFMVGLISTAVTFLIFKQLPVAFIRCLNWILTHTFYRTRIIGKENMPKTGGALLVCNHVSYMDPPLVLASLERPVRFLMFRDYYESKFLHGVSKIMQAIPVSFTDRPREILKSLETARKAVENGDLVCIFAEGGLTRTGQMLPFKKGFERIMKGLNAPIIPIHIDRIWGSIFSFKNGKYFWKLPEVLPYPIAVSFGKPMESGAKAHEVRQAVQELGADAFQYRREAHKHLHTGFLRQAKSHPWRECFVDSSGVSLNGIKSLAGALSLSRIFKKCVGDSKMVGVMLPTSIAGALTNLGLLIGGYVPVNLNFTASKDSIASAKKQCEMQTVITSRKFLEKTKMEKTDDMLLLEDLVKEQSNLSKLSWALRCLVLPAFLLKKLYFEKNVTSEDIATIIFSSGSTGEPKGVMLTHSNIASNVQAIYDIFKMDKQDSLVGVLPFFHSFGFTGTLWLPLLAGIKAIYHTSPLDAAIVGKMVQKHHGTVLLSTPTFLQAYMRKCTPEQLASLRQVIVGAEKLKDRVANAFHEKFSVMPLEGYGATELSPFATLNIEDYREQGIKQVGQKKGKIGHPIPGVAIKVIDPDTEQVLSPGENGLLLIKGPNVMKGYLGQPDKTAEVLKDGWYSTGDIANVDDDGFITITDRLSRFSKIGGEMVPHIKVEESIHAALEEVEQMCAVTSIAEERKGEKLIVLHTKEIDVAQVRKKMAEEGLPSLWIPKLEDFYKIDSLPVLGSGKLDLKALKIMAQNLSEVGNV